MYSYSSIFFLVVYLWILQLGGGHSGQLNSTDVLLLEGIGGPGRIQNSLKNVSASYTKKINPNNDFFMRPSLELSSQKRQQMIDHCRSMGSKCKYSENCCSFLCLKRSKICVS